MKKINWSNFFRQGIFFGIGFVLGVFIITIAYELMMTFIYAFYTQFNK